MPEPAKTGRAPISGRRPSPSFWAGRRVLLTGHTGFKGAWMTMLLHRLGAVVHGFSLPEPVSQPNLFERAGLSGVCVDRRGDVRDFADLKDCLEQAEPNVIIHMAAQAIVRVGFLAPVETFAVNVLGVANILEASRSAPGLRVSAIVTSDKCYENREVLSPYRENDAMGGHDPYSASKGCAELVTASYARTYFTDGRVRVISLRSGNVIGGGDWASDRLLPDLVRAASTRTQAEIRNPLSVRPWQHVLDPLNGYLLAVERAAQAQDWPGFDSWNFGPNPGEELPVREVVEAFQACWDGAPAVSFGRPIASEHEAGLLRVDPTKAKVELGWRSCTSNRGAVESVVNWARDCETGVDPRQRSLYDIEHLLNV